MSPRTSQKPDHRARVEAEMFRLHEKSFSLLPLGAGRDGKSPMVKFKHTPKLPIQQVIAPMMRARSLAYAVRLGGWVVLDVDEFDEGLLLELTDRFGPALVQVRTARGMHLYYRAPNGRLPNLRQEGLPVDVISGPNVYVVGPGSIRPAGEEYHYASAARLGEIELTVLDLSSEPASILAPAAAVAAARPAPEISLGSDDKVKIGTRNKHLSTKAIELVRRSADAHELLQKLLFERDAHCQNPETVSDEELRKIAAWGWRKRLENSIFEERNSSFLINRNAIDRLKGKPGSSDAKALYLDLIDQHGHCPGKSFALVYASMRAAGSTDLSRERFLAARRMLETDGLLQKAANHSPGMSHAQFQLMRPVPDGVQRFPS